MKKFIKSLLITTVILIVLFAVIWIILSSNLLPVMKLKDDSVISTINDSPTPTVNPTATPTSTPTPTPTIDEVEVSGKKYQVKPIKYSMYAFDDVNVYPIPDENTDRLLKIGYNLPVEVIGEVTVEDVNWCKVQDSDTIGFVKQEMLMSDYVTIPLPKPANLVQPTTAKDVLYIGNSISIYPATSDWWGESYGMGASSADRDWIHLTTAATGLGGYDVTSLRSWEFSKTRNEELSALDTYLSAYDYHYVVIMLGENCNSRVSMLGNDMCDLIKYIRLWNPDAQIAIVDNFWKAPWISSIKKSVCSKTGASFIDLSDISGVAEYAWHVGDIYTAPDGTQYEVNKVLAQHPNDSGYQAIADKVISWFN